MRLTTIVLLLCLTTTLTAQTSFTRIGEEDAAKSTFLIIDFYATWCGPCKTMDERVWSQDTVQSLQSRFVNRRIDATNRNTELVKYGIEGISGDVRESRT